MEYIFPSYMIENQLRENEACSDWNDFSNFRADKKKINIHEYLHNQPCTIFCVGILPQKQYKIDFFSSAFPGNTLRQVAANKCLGLIEIFFLKIFSICK